MRSYFITGTGTGVGKTVLTAALIAAARSAGCDAVPMKPVQTGAVREGSRWRAPDLDFCLRVAGLEVDATTYAGMAPCCYAPPCSPHLAARESGRPVVMADLVAAFRRLETQHEAVLVEGAGGVLVPVSETRTMLDLMVALRLPVIVAATPGLGTLNHSLLTLRALRASGLGVAGIVFMEVEDAPWGRIEEDNLRTIEAMGSVAVMGPIPYLDLTGDPRAQLIEQGSRILARLGRQP